MIQFVSEVAAALFGARGKAFPELLQPLDAAIGKALHEGRPTRLIDQEALGNETRAGHPRIHREGS